MRPIKAIGSTARCSNCSKSIDRAGVVKTRRLLAILLAFWLLPALACNLPVAPDPTRAPAPVLTQPSPVSPHPTSTPPQDFNRALPKDLVPTAAPAPRGAWGFPGLDRVSATPTDDDAGALEQLAPPDGQVTYLTQPGDTLAALVKRFAVQPGDIQVPAGIDAGGYLPPATPLSIAVQPASTLPSSALLPDSEILYGPSSAGFSVESYVRDANAYLNSYSEVVDGETLTGAQIVARVAEEDSINPRILLAFLEFRSGWVLGWPKQPVDTQYPVGFVADGYVGLYKEMVLVGRQLSIGFYSWRLGNMDTLEFPQGSPARLSPRINAGTAAVSLLLSKLYFRGDFGPALYGAHGFAAFYAWMFGDPWARAAAVEPQPAPNFMQSLPELQLPISSGAPWSFTGGPHADWSTGSPWGALDFAPAGESHGCYISKLWATAAASGLVTYARNGIVLISLDPSGSDHVGWALLYLHLADQDRVQAGARVQTGDNLGHPSCQGGVATGTHVHFARKYNGEWMGAGAEAPLVLSGWRVEPGTDPYLGRLVRSDGATVAARLDGSSPSVISR